MSYRNRTGLCGLLIVSTLAIASACGGLDKVTVVITDEAGQSGNPSGGGHPAGGSSAGGETSSDSGAAGAIGVAGAAGAAGEKATGGEGGQMTIPDPMPGAPTVVAVSPRDTSTGVDPTGPIHLTFSEPLDPASVTSDSVQIKDESGALVSGALSYADAAVNFRPAARLNLLGTYTVNVTTAVTDAGKTAMERPFTSSFTVRDGVWGKAEASITSSTSTFDRLGVVALATDGAGRAAAAWAQVTDAGSTYDIYCALFYEGKGWATPVKVNTNALTSQYPSIAMNASGNLIVGWIETDATVMPATYSVQARRNIAGMWDAASTRIDNASMSTLLQNPRDVAVAINANGHAHVVWTSWDNNTTVTPSVNEYGVFARHVDATGTWDASVYSLTYWQQSSGASAPALAFDAAGNGFVAYQLATFATPTKTSTYVFRYLASTNKWGTSAVASTTADGGAMPVAVATSPTGEAILSYQRATNVDTTTTNYDLMGSYYNKAWSAPTVISSATTLISNTKTQAVWTGTSFLVAWSQSGGSLGNVYTNQYKAAWGSATIISDGNHSSAFPWLSADRRGNVLAVWAQTSDTAASDSDVVSSRLVGATDKWSNPEHVSSALAIYRYSQAVTLGDGTAVAAWQRWLVNGKLQSVNGVLENDFQ